MSRYKISKFREGSRPSLVDPIAIARPPLNRRGAKQRSSGFLRFQAARASPSPPPPPHPRHRQDQQSSAPFKSLAIPALSERVCRDCAVPARLPGDSYPLQLPSPLPSALAAIRRQSSGKVAPARSLIPFPANVLPLRGCGIAYPVCYIALRAYTVVTASFRAYRASEGLSRR